MNEKRIIEEITLDLIYQFKGFFFLYSSNEELAKGQCKAIAEIIVKENHPFDLRKKVKKE